MTLFVPHARNTHGCPSPRGRPMCPPDAPSSHSSLWYYCVLRTHPYRSSDPFFFATIGILSPDTAPAAHTHTVTETRCRPTAWRGAHKLAREVRAGAASTWMGTLHPPSPASPCHPRRAAPTEAAENPPTHTPPELDASPPRAARSAAHSSSDAVIASRISRCAPASSVLRMVETARSTCAWIGPSPGSRGGSPPQTSGPWARRPGERGRPQVGRAASPPTRHARSMRPSRTHSAGPHCN